MTTPFLTDLTYVLHLMRGLLDRAEARLPREIDLAHWIAIKTGPNPWQAVEEKFPGRQDVQAAKTLTGIVCELEGLIADEEALGRPIDLSLKRYRGRP